MTTLLVVTFVFGGVHTLLWLPRAFQMRREQKEAGARRPATPGSDAPESRKDGDDAG
jgi:hypothetical protein